MTAAPDLPARPGLALRLLFAVPVLGWIAKDMTRDTENILYGIVVALTLLVLAVKVWGLVALTLTALAAVPVIFVLLICITQG